MDKQVDIIIGCIQPADLARLQMSVVRGDFQSIANFFCQSEMLPNIHHGENNSRLPGGCWLADNEISWADLIEAVGSAFSRACFAEKEGWEARRNVLFNTLMRTVIDSMEGTVALLEADGTILTVNKAWIKFAVDNGYEIETDTKFLGLGANYLEKCDACDELHADRVAALIRQVAEQGPESGHEHLSAVYPCNSLTEDLWYKVFVSPIHYLDQTYILLQHVNVTDAADIDGIHTIQ